jgi:hypothetical protein
VEKFIAKNQRVNKWLACATAGEAKFSSDEVFELR